MGNAFSALLFLGLGVGSSLLTTARTHPRKKTKRYFVGNTVVGCTGAWLGGLLFGPVGPSIYGISVIASALSSLGAVFGYNWIADKLDKRSGNVDEDTA